ncbi:MAG: bifunctional 2-polyprenyl-6-hydroxyphenol methylase/3-demethylubiquinol 3-O-methyltransferase UbiG [Woeseiaceae bacterium]|nr:bifunctional 2-polyprenyl-6-hydroxyphenol methylase/3-demethylubiquinol 3-O-methyltransferase UbiG [Woeseiaceae bacterium]
MNHDLTIDPREVEFYSGLAETWWDRDGPFWPLHKLNELRVAYILGTLCRRFRRSPAGPAPLAGLRVLDVGCGGGILAESMAELGADVTGIDVVERNIRVAALHARQSGLPIDYRVTTVGELARTTPPFDVVLNMEVVEHVADPAAFMADCCRMTGADGVMFVATINRTLRSWLFAIIGAEYVLRWLPRGTHRWRMFRRPGELTAMLEANGLTVRETRGVAANPLTKRLHMTRSTAVNFMLFATRRTRREN